MKLSKQQRKVLLFLAESRSGAWSRGMVRRHLFGSRSTRAQSASFCRMLGRLEKHDLIKITTNFLVGCGADGAEIGITVAGRSIISRLQEGSTNGA